MPHATRAGDVLADRYRLVDLLSESGGGRFWRAHDRILERHVALHVIAADDPRAELLLDAARRSATVLDPRILRVLDAERTERLLLRRQRVGVRHLARHHAREQRAALAATWRVDGQRGGRLDRGRARARRRPRAAGRRRTCCSTTTARSGSSASASTPRCTACRRATRSATCVDLAGLLHATLTGRWAGVSPSGVPRAPEKHGRVLRPRQVRAGVPAASDDLCDELLNPRGQQDPGRPRPRQRPRHPELPGRLRRRPDRAGPGDRGRQPGEERDGRAPRRPRDPGPAAPGRLGAAGRARRAGRPSPSQSPSRNPSRSPMRRTSCPPRPACRSSTTRTTRSPGCAPATSRRRRHRRSRSRRSARCSPDGGAGKPRYARPDAGPVVAARRRVLALRPRPLERQRSSRPSTSSTDTREQVPGRNWLRLAMLVAVVLVLLVAVAIAFNLGRGKTPLGAEPDRRAQHLELADGHHARAVADAVHGPAGRRLRPPGGRRGELRRRRRCRRRRPEHVVDDVDLQAAARTRRAQARRRSGPRPRPVQRRTSRSSSPSSASRPRSRST